MARPTLKTVLIFAAVLCLWSTSSLAANISLSPLDNDPAHALVAVEGDLEVGDHIKFRTQVGRLTNAFVTFNSEGGNLLAGIEIGKTIRMKSFTTGVFDGSRCASACAFAWLGGLPRWMERGAQIGFHAAYIERAGRASESGVGNALIGSYLTQLGLSENAVVYITQAAPDEMTWLTLRDAEQIGIEVLPWELYFKKEASTKQSGVTSRSSPEQELGRRAQLFVSEIHSRWSGTNRLEWLDPLYAEYVNFNGDTISRDKVLIEKRLFTERWPERSYRIQDKSMNAACDKVECTVTGTVDWATRSLARNATASGLASFTYVLRASGNTFVIRSEHGSVLQRRK